MYSPTFPKALPVHYNFTTSNKVICTSVRGYTSFKSITFNIYFTVHSSMIHFVKHEEFELAGERQEIYVVFGESKSAGY